MKHTLEDSKLFPYIAWVTFIGFAAFVFFLTMEMKNDFNQIDQRTNVMEQNLSNKDLDIQQ